MPKNGFEPIFKSYKEFVLPIKLYRLYLIIKKKFFFNKIINIYYFIKYNIIYN
jgi:hypothetical protein